jgi:hypothetical protein
MAFFRKYLHLLILLTLGGTAFIRGIIFLDPDFGWHLKMGELIMNHGIPLTDPFSYTMPSYRFVDHEWLSNVLISTGYKSIGIYGLSFIFALIFILTLFIVVPKKLRKHAFFPLALTGSLMLGFSGIRTQVITWFFLSIILRVIFDENLWRKWKFFLPLLFIPWVNLHGGFAIGIILLFLVFIFKSFQNKKFELGYCGIAVFSIALTFVNPYGPRIWWEIWMQLSDTNLRWNISEWMPGIFYIDFAFFILLTLSFFLVVKYRARIAGLISFLYLCLLLMALSSLRYVPLWALSAILATSTAAPFLIAEVKKTTGGVVRLSLAKKILVVVILPVFLYEIYISLVSAYALSEQKYYPVKAIKYLSKQNLNGNLFTSYDYGGYLTWKLPNKKAFIDGRMPSWRRSGYYPNESNYAFKDYLKMLSDESFFKKMLLKYNIHYVLLPTPQTAKNRANSFFAKLEKYLQKLEFWRTNYKVLNEDLTNLGMKRIYSDGQFVIYKN